MNNHINYENLTLENAPSDLIVFDAWGVAKKLREKRNVYTLGNLLFQGHGEEA